MADERGRVVRARVAERAGHDGVGREAVRHAEALRARQAEREAHRLRKVTRDGARLRRHPQRPAAPHLVTALADRILARGDHAEQRVEDRRAARQLASARHHEGARPIVQECRIVDPQPGADERVVLVSSRADGVEAAVRLLQLARRDVKLARGELVLEQGKGPCDRELGTFPERGIGGSSRCGAGRAVSR